MKNSIFPRNLMCLFVAIGVALSVGPVPNALGETILASTSLDGGQEVPPVATAGLGVGILNVDSVTGLYDFSMFVSGIDPLDLQAAGPNGTPVHIHSAPVGANGGIVVDLGWAGTITPIGTLGFSLDVTGGTFGGTQGALAGPSVATNLASLLGDNLYVNVHTTAHPGGEIRGQLIHAVVPEPSALVLLAPVLGVVCWWRRRRKS